MNAVKLAPANELGDLAARIRTGRPLSIGAITLVPLFSDEDGPEADLLEESIARGHTTVTEVSERGSVNLLTVSNHGPRLLLLLDGEEVIGAKQNRVFNASFLVAPGATVDLPVSCVEHGRWRYRSANFGSSGRTLNSQARASKLERTTQSVTLNRRYDSDQGAVWSDVEGYLRRTNTQSPTSAYSDGAARREAFIDDLIPEPGRNQIGVAVVHGEKLLSIEVLGSPDLFRRSWKKIARGVLTDVYPETLPPCDAKATVHATLFELPSIPVVRNTPPGNGETLHGKAGIAIGALVHGGKVYHLLAGGGLQ
jgi:hypothetical protein